MWYCYTIIKETNFKHLSLITENLQEIYDFITAIKDIESFKFEIEKISLTNKN